MIDETSNNENNEIEAQPVKTEKSETTTETNAKIDTPANNDSSENVKKPTEAAATSEDTAREKSKAPAPRDGRRGGYRPQGNGGNKRPFQRNPRYRKKFCRFCYNKELKINYREPQVLEGFITERGKILPRRITGTCAKHQRELARAIKQARILSLLPFVVK